MGRGTGTFRHIGHEIEAAVPVHGKEGGDEPVLTVRPAQRNVGQGAACRGAAIQRAVRQGIAAQPVAKPISLPLTGDIVKGIPKELYAAVSILIQLDRQEFRNPYLAAAVPNAAAPAAGCGEKQQE